jgi:hypothetical protein
VYKSSGHETFDAGNNEVFMSGENDKYVCMCNIENENCIYGVCTSYGGTKTLKVLVHNELYCDNRVQTVGSDRQSNFHMTMTQQSDELIESLVSKIPELTLHHYTARYLKESKENLQSDQCIILVYFS